MDVDECISSPCSNGAMCTESACEPSSYPDGTVCTAGIDDDPRPGVDRYRCMCEPGYSNGHCAPDWDIYPEIGAQYNATCSEMATGGNCDVDINECLSGPCEHGGVCTEQPNAYNCSCVAGYGGENCAVDVDECASEPCANGAVCLESSSEPLVSGCDDLVDETECLDGGCAWDGLCADAEPCQAQIDACLTDQACLVATTTADNHDTAG
eukprot:COSAG02_NODE_26606_length_629_cov_1.075472_1_plen_209_part_11